MPKEMIFDLIGAWCQLQVPWLLTCPAFSLPSSGAGIATVGPHRRKAPTLTYIAPASLPSLFYDALVTRMDDT
jgi:hypothetical protein